MANKKDALTAISNLNGKELKGRALKVNEAQLKKTYDNNGGGNGGGGGATSTLRLRGVASTGAVLANAAVAVNCATGTKSGAAGADGQYDLTLDTAQLPCIVQATSADGIAGFRAGWVFVAVCGVVAAAVSLAQPRRTGIAS